MKVLNFENGHKAWAGINKLFINQEEELFSSPQGASITNSLYTYGLTLAISNAEFDDNFDFGKILGYSQGKWSSLLNNYLDLDALDQLKLQIRELEKNKAINRNYHIGFNFADSHGNGKGCLVSGMFSRMIGTEKPLLTVIMRASEVVTRLPWDLLLSIRMGEYVYGHNQFSIEVIMRSAFADDISLMLYNGYEPIEPLISNIENEERRKRLKKTLKKVKKAADDGEDPGYQAYMRVYKIFNPDKYRKKQNSLLAKDCIIGDWDGIPMPNGGLPSIIARNNLKKAYLKFIEKYNLDIFAEADTKKKIIKFKESDGSIIENTELENDDPYNEPDEE